MEGHGRWSLFDHIFPLSESVSFCSAVLGASVTSRFERLTFFRKYNKFTKNDRMI